MHVPDFIGTVVANIVHLVGAQHQVFRIKQ